MKRNIILTLACVAVLKLTAQPPGATVDLKDTYKPKLADANKFQENPKVTDSVPKTPLLNYTVAQSQFKTGFELDPIKAATIKGGPGNDKLYRAHAKVGFGNYTTPYGELWVNSLRSKTMSLGLHYRHLSSTGKIKDVAYPGYSTNELDLNGKGFVGKHTVSGSLYYNRNARHYYGYSPSEFNLSKKDILQYFNHVGFNLSGESNYIGDSSRIHHKIDMGYYYLTDRFKTTEHLFDIGGNAWFNNGDLTYGGALFFDYIQNKNSLDTINTYLTTIKPMFRAKGDKYVVNAGINAYLNIQDTTTRFYFHPTVSASFNVYEDYFIVFAGINGQFKRNTYLGLTTQNMFMNTNTVIENTNHKLQLNGGFKGALSRSLSYKIDVNREMVDNMPLFVNDTTPGPRNTFFLKYDTVRVFNVNAEFAFAKGERFSIAARGEFYSYKPRNEEKAWHLPSYRIALNSRYNIQDKIVIKADVYVIGTRYARVFSTDSLGLPVTPFIAKALKPYVDANLGIEYRYNKVLSAFLNVNNIAARRYERWNGYPSQRINFILGIAYSL